MNSSIYMHMFKNSYAPSFFNFICSILLSELILAQPDIEEESLYRLIMYISIFFTFILLPVVYLFICYACHQCLLGLNIQIEDQSFIESSKFMFVGISVYEVFRFFILAYWLLNEDDISIYSLEMSHYDDVSHVASIVFFPLISIIFTYALKKYSSVNLIYGFISSAIPFSILFCLYILNR